MSDQIQTSAEVAENHAMPRCHEVHARPGQPCMEEAAKSLPQTPVDQKSPAQWAYERLILYIGNFEKTLGDAARPAQTGRRGPAHADRLSPRAGSRTGVKLRQVGP
jgi:hypothetical protein